MLRTRRPALPTPPSAFTSSRMAKLACDIHSVHRAAEPSSCDTIQCLAYSRQSRRPGAEPDKTSHSVIGEVDLG
jgi:hypothetical protein